MHKRFYHAVSSVRILFGKWRQRILPGAMAYWISGGRVARGPFQGVRYCLSSSGSALAPKLMGTYEFEVQPLIEQMIQFKPSLCIVAGAAEGYYAIGLNYRLPGVPIIAYESAEHARNNLLRMIELNCCNPIAIEIRDTFGEDSISGINDQRCGIVMDIEGDEWRILNNVSPEELSRAFLIVEMHERENGNRIGLFQKFSETHHIEEIRQARRPITIPGMGWLERREILQCEFRSEWASNYWLLLRPRRFYNAKVSCARN